jgi:hypothetical protein
MTANHQFDPIVWPATPALSYVRPARSQSTSRRERPSRQPARLISASYVPIDKFFWSAARAAALPQLAKSGTAAAAGPIHVIHL